MKLVQRLFMGLGGLAGGVVLLTMVSPKAHAVVATLVEVANTRSTPVPNQDVDSPARHPYQSNCSSFGGTDQNDLVSCQMVATPPNTELVVQNISMVLYNTVPVYPGVFTTQEGGFPANDYLLLGQQSSITYVASQPLIQYSDPNTRPSCQFQVTTSNPNSVLFCSINGYTVSLP